MDIDRGGEGGARSTDERALEIHQLVGRMEVRLFSSIVCGGMSAMSGPHLPQHGAAAPWTTLYPDQKPTSFSLSEVLHSHSRLQKR